MRGKSPFLVRGRGEGGLTRFSVGFSCLTVPNLSKGNLLVFHFFRVLKNFIHKRGISRFCVEDFLFLTTEKFLSGTLLCFRNFLVWKKFRDKKVGVSFYRGNFFISRRRKASWANPSVFENVSSRERIMDEKGVSRYSVGSFLLIFYVSQYRKVS